MPLLAVFELLFVGRGPSGTVDETIPRSEAILALVTTGATAPGMGDNEDVVGKAFDTLLLPTAD